MSATGQKQGAAPSRRRYLVHLLCLIDRRSKNSRYIARIRPSAARNVRAEIGERTFADECELIATINPLLPPGSDVRDVFEHIESPNGFFYLLHLNREEAVKLGWQLH